MWTYQFQVRVGQSAPYRSLKASDDDDFFTKLREYESQTGEAHIHGTIIRSMHMQERVEEPALRNAA